MSGGKDRISLGHGSGGKMTHDLINKVIVPALYGPNGHPPMEDSALLPSPGQSLSFTTDSYVVSPCFFPGGDIGDLAVNGTVNDLAMSGAMPVAISAGLILEEGLPVDGLRRILESMGRAAKNAGVKIVCGDTKVVHHGKADGIFINTSGVGVRPDGLEIHASAARPGDVIIINGTIGDHGIAVMSVREGLSFQAPVVSDTAALHTLVRALLEGGVDVHVLRDPTRGGLATTVCEIASDAGVKIWLDEGAIPVSTAVVGACELLGIDPLTVANEGKMVAIVAPEDADRALSIMKGHPHGKDSAIIGKVLEAGNGRVTMTSVSGGQRVVNMPSGEILPRIC